MNVNQCDSKTPVSSFRNKLYNEIGCHSGVVKMATEENNETIETVLTFCSAFLVEPPAMFSVSSHP